MAMFCHLFACTLKEQAICNFTLIIPISLWSVHMGSQVLSPTSLEANPCNLDHWEPGSWDLLITSHFTLHTMSPVLSPKYDTDAYMAMFCHLFTCTLNEQAICNFTLIIPINPWSIHMGSQVLSPTSLELNPCNLNHWEHKSWDLINHFTRGPCPKSHVWRRCLQGDVLPPLYYTKAASYL